MNKSKIEWCTMSWNPVTGCLHGCTYCYAEDIANRFAAKTYTYNKDLYTKDFTAVLVAPTKTQYVHTGYVKTEPYPFGFLPTFYKYRLYEPKAKPKPQNIFVCSMADLFGDWVPDEWIGKVFESCEEAPQHRYMFLTKNSIKMREAISKWIIKKDTWSWINDNWWFGTTVTCQKDVERIGELHIDTNCFISIEPLLEPVQLDYRLEWVIVGAQTGLGAKPPEPEWVQSIISQCRDANIPLFLKNNLNWPMKIQEFPWDVKEGN